MLWKMLSDRSFQGGDTNSFLLSAQPVEECKLRFAHPWRTTGKDLIFIFLAWCFFLSVALLSLSCSLALSLTPWMNVAEGGQPKAQRNNEYDLIVSCVSAVPVHPQCKLFTCFSLSSLFHSLPPSCQGSRHSTVLHRFQIGMLKCFCWVLITAPGSGQSPGFHTAVVLLVKLGALTTGPGSVSCSAGEEPVYFHSDTRAQWRWGGNLAQRVHVLKEHSKSAYQAHSEVWEHLTFQINSSKSACFQFLCIRMSIGCSGFSILPWGLKSLSYFNHLQAKRFSVFAFDKKLKKMNCLKRILHTEEHINIINII